MSGMGGYDAASIVGMMGGLGDQRPKGRVSPEQLVKRFCDGRAEGLARWHGLQVDPNHHGARVARGWCGYVGGRGDDLEVGFDDGYEFMGYLGERGWKPLPAVGDWPYVVWMMWSGASNVLVQYLEADFALWSFDSREALRAFVKTLQQSD